MRIARLLGLVLLAACGGHNVDLDANDGGSGTDGGESAGLFSLEGILAPPQDHTAWCTVSLDPTRPTLSSGVLDVEAEAAFSNAYHAEFVVGSRSGGGSVEASRVIIAGATVTITDSTGKEVASYTTLGAGECVLPSGGVARGVVDLEIVDPDTVESLRATLPPFGKTTITTRTQAFGRTLGGEILSSNVFEFGITACRGCLIEFDTDPAVEPQPNCFGHAGVAGQTPRVFGQDVPFDCHACSDTLPFCLCAKSSCPK